MALRIHDRWIWDFWFVDHDGEHHCFFLQAPRALGDPELRHWNVSIGHAVSSDLSSWTVLPDALGPGAPGSWDDYSTWTGSIVEHGGRWYLLYTGTSRVEDGLVQRIGLATSDDLSTWTRHPGPVLEPDPRWYETLDRDAWFDQAWRDPWVVRADGGGFLAYITARARVGEAHSRGVVGVARSDDLVAWEVLPPVTEPMGFGQMEVPQLVPTGDGYHLIFASDTGTQGPLRRAEGLGTGTFSLHGPTPGGPFRAETLHPVEADAAGTTYAGKVIARGGELHFVAWQRIGEDGDFAGWLTVPRPIAVGADRRLVVADATWTATA